MLNIIGYPSPAVLTYTNGQPYARFLGMLCFQGEGWGWGQGSMEEFSNFPSHSQNSWPRNEASNQSRAHQVQSVPARHRLGESLLQLQRSHMQFCH